MGISLKGFKKDRKRWEKELKKRKGMPRPLFVLGWIYLEEGRRAEVEDMVKKEKNKSYKGVLQALMAHREGDREGIIASLQDVGDEGEEGLWKRILLVLGEEGDEEKIKSILQESPDHPLAPALLLKLAETLYLKGDLSGALGHLANMEPQDRVALLLGRIYLEKGNATAAKGFLETALKSRHKELQYEALQLLAGIHAQKEEWARAASSLQRAYNLTEDPSLVPKIVGYLIEAGKGFEAWELVKETGATLGEKLLLRLAKRLEEEGKQEESLECMAVLGGDTAKIARARSLIEKEPKEALKLLEEVISSEDGSSKAVAHHLAAQALMELEDVQRAVKYLKEAGVDAAADLEPLSWHKEAAKIFIEAGEFEYALEHLRRLIELPDGKKTAKELVGAAKKALKNTDLPEEELKRLKEELDEIKGETSFFKRLKEGLSKSRKGIGEKMEAQLDQLEDASPEEVEERIEEILLEADVGVPTTQRLLSVIAKARERGDVKGKKGLIHLIRNEMVAMLKRAQQPFQIGPERPFFITVVGVNGTGKTTTIAKLANKLKKEGFSVLLAAGDTFRAAGSQQLEEWGKRLGLETISQLHGSDPSGVAYDAAKAGVARNKDVVILDTAGRLHTKVNLMEELKKVERVVSKEIPGAPHATLLVLDATTGQNALSQAKIFSESVKVSGIVLTKLDGTAKGGIVLAIANELSLPIFFIGVGEGMDDLQPFDAESFVDAIFEEE